MQPQISDRAGHMVGEPNRVRHLRLIDITEAHAQVSEELVDLRSIPGPIADFKDQGIGSKRLGEVPHPLSVVRRVVEAIGEL
jgi:hypothetical protein